LSAGAAWAQLPTLVTISPVRIVAGSGDTTVSVSGTKLKSTFQVCWNGQARPTQFVSAWTLKARIPASDLAQPGLAQVSVFDPNSGAPVSGNASLMVFLPLQNWDLASDSVRARIYVSLSKSDANGQSVAVVDSAKGIVERYIPMPAEPGQMALSSGSRYLYVAMSDRIRRIDLSGGTGDLDILFSASFPPGMDSEPFWVHSILALPGDGTSFVMVYGGNYEFSSAVVVDGVTPRPNYSNAAPYCLVGVSGGTLLYGGPGLSVLSLGANGMPYSATIAAAGLTAGQSCPVAAGGLLYGGNGDIVNPVTPQRVGRLGGWGLVDVAPDRSQAYFVGYESPPTTSNSGPVSLMVFDTNSQAMLKSVPIPVNLQTYLGRMVHWGTDGVAFGDFASTYTNAPSDGLYLVHVQALN
jgi:hypothetical protein